MLWCHFAAESSGITINKNLTHPPCPISLIGWHFEVVIFVMILQGEKDDKIIAVCADDPEFRHYTDIKELPPHRLAEIRRFFEDCIHLSPLLLLYLWYCWSFKFLAMQPDNDTKCSATAGLVTWFTLAVWLPPTIKFIILPYIIMDAWRPIIIFYIESHVLGIPSPVMNDRQEEWKQVSRGKRLPACWCCGRCDQVLNVSDLNFIQNSNYNDNISHFIYG